MPNDQLLYMKILKYLKDKIFSKQLLPGQRLPTEMELAAQFGVSRITSKKAMEELEKEGLIYRKRGQGSFVSLYPARTTYSGLEKVISIIFPYNGADGWVMSYINGAMSYLSPKGYYLSIHCTEGHDEVERSFLKELPSNGIGGIIYYPTSTIKNIDALNLTCINKYPIVTIDKYFEGIPLSSVTSDNLNGEYMLIEYLIKLGHKRIAYLGNEDIGEKSSLRDRYLGYCKALKDNYIQIDLDIASTGYIKEIEHPELEGNRIEYLKRKITYLMGHGVTAIALQNDMDAIFMMKVLRDMNVNVPKDISITGFDNMELLGQLGISLTTVCQNFYEVGRKAAETIVSMKEGRYEFKREAVPCQLIIRETTGITSSSSESSDKG